MVDDLSSLLFHVTTGLRVYTIPTCTYSLTQGTLTYAPITTTDLECSSDHQGLESTHYQCTLPSSLLLDLNLGHSCRTPLNPLLWCCNSPEIHSGEQLGNHSQLKERKFAGQTSPNIAIAHSHQP